MIRKFIVINMILICFLCLSASCNTNKQISKKLIKQECINLIINNEFSNTPLGQREFTKTFLLDTLFKETFREECSAGSREEDFKYYLNFYPGKNKFFFIKRKKNYELSSAEINDNNSAVRLKVNADKLGIDYTKEYFKEKFKLKDLKLCDKIQVNDEEGNSGHWFYFQNNKITKIKLFTIDVD